MKVLVIGSGGREDALAWKLSKSLKVTKVYIAPGNPGTARWGENVGIAAEDIEGLKTFALNERMDLTVVGPEHPLTLGITDAFTDAGLLVFGPTKAGARIEGSKAYAKQLMAKARIPTAFYKQFTDASDAEAYIESHSPPFVVKADGLAAGKGVVICKERKEALSAIDSIMRRREFGSAGERVVIEEFLEGEEASFLAITDGSVVVPLAPAQDHKAIFDGDKGPNTGGMGAYSPAPVIGPELEKTVMDTVMRPAVEALRADGCVYRGVLYAGLMIKDNAPKVLEFNCRFGDPETQPILMRLDEDLFDILLDAAKGQLADRKLRWFDKSAVCVVMASAGYPGAYEKGKEIYGLYQLEGAEDTVVFHAGTSTKDERLVTSGGRVLGVTALGSDVADAIRRAYLAVSQIKFEGAQYRKDIGKKAIR